MALYGLRDLAAGDEGVYTLALFSADPGVRLAAISGIGRLARTTLQAHDALLITVERDADAGVRRAAAVTLGKVAGAEPRVRAALERIRATSTDVDLVRAAKRGLPKT
jgi:HEAT repeat protein